MLLLGAFVIGGAVLLIWQPDSLKQGVLEFGLSQVNAKGPYRIVVGAVHGNVFRTITLQDVRVYAQASGAELARAKAMKVAFRWKDPFRKKVEVRSFLIEDPVLVLRFDRRNNLLFPRPPPAHS